jgi:xanthine/uracil permease
MVVFVVATVVVVPLTVKLPLNVKLANETLSLVASDWFVSDKSVAAIVILADPSND